MKTKEQKLIELANEALNSNDVCSEWKSKINKALGNELEVGKWYKNGKAIISYQGKNKKSYGFGNIGYWTTDYLADNFINEYWELATKEEVEEALIKEAKKRGYKEGVIYLNNNVLWSEYGCVFDNGKWATSIEEDIIEVNGIKYKRCD